MADPQNPSIVLAGRNVLPRRSASSSVPGPYTASGIALAASTGANIATAAASTSDFALPLRRSVRTALSGDAQRVYSSVGAIASLRSRSVSQGSLIQLL